jgi:hypothetical protein
LTCSCPVLPINSKAIVVARMPMRKRNPMSIVLCRVSECVLDSEFRYNLFATKCN